MLKNVRNVVKPTTPLTGAVQRLPVGNAKVRTMESSFVPQLTKPTLNAPTVGKENMLQKNAGQGRKLKRSLSPGLHQLPRALHQSHHIEHQ